MTLSEVFLDFILYQQAIGNSEKTVDYYKNCLVPFIEYFGSHFNIQLFNANNLRKYAFSLRNKGLTSNSIKTYSKGIKAFLSWLYLEEYTAENLSNKYPMPKGQRKVIQVLTDSEIKTLFDCFDVDTHLGLRNYCICGLMLDCGLRKSEVVLLEIDDLFLGLDNPYIVVNGKGGKQRIVPVGGSLCVRLRDYLRYCSNYTEGQFFLTRSDEPISHCTIERLFKTLKDKTGIKRIRAHLLRHTFATRYLQNGGDIYSLQSILGHSDLDMVQVYMHISQSQVINNFKEFSPLDRLL